MTNTWWLCKAIYYLHSIPTTDIILNRFISAFIIMRALILLSLQETLCGCRPEVLGNLRNECFLYFVNVDQWDNSI
jgi:hypothetical protein